ncbi:MAG TPA: hypothetical protein VHE61_06815 [Opitutaceae bacterium]|nr:hypothetical protein [Opitutaceae bacterium]
MSKIRTNAAGWRYVLHGFGLESELELTALLGDEACGRAADVVLRFDAVPDRLDGASERGACYAAGRGEVLFWLPGLVRISVRGGREMTVQTEVESAVDLLPGLLLSSPLAALLLQREMLPLHASAVATSHGAAVFVGGAAIGKSTLAAAMGQRGLVPVSDDVTALRIADHHPPAVIPGCPRIRLWPDAVAALGLDPMLPELRPGLAKRWLSFSGGFAATPLPIAVICVLDRGITPAGTKLVRELAGMAAVSAMFNAVYRPAFARGMGLERQVFSQATTLAKQTRIVSLTLPADCFAPVDLARRVVEELWP